MNLNSIANSARKTGRFAVLTGALLGIGSGCATQVTHATQQMAKTAAPEVLRVSHAERNLALARASGHYSEDMITLARNSKNVDEAAQILVDGANAYHASEEVAKITCAKLTKETCQGQAPTECIATRVCVLESTSEFSNIFNDVRDRLLILLAR